jgi:hypothetical protein
VSVAIWNEKASVCGKSGPPFSPMQGMPQTVNCTTSTSPALLPGLSMGERCTACTSLSGKTEA